MIKIDWTKSVFIFPQSKYKQTVQIRATFKDFIKDKSFENQALFCKRECLLMETVVWIKEDITYALVCPEVRDRYAKVKQDRIDDKYYAELEKDKQLMKKDRPLMKGGE